MWRWKLENHFPGYVLGRGEDLAVRQDLCRAIALLGGFGHRAHSIPDVAPQAGEARGATVFAAFDFRWLVTDLLIMLCWLHIEMAMTKGYSSLTIFTSYSKICNVLLLQHFLAEARYTEGRARSCPRGCPILKGPQLVVLEDWLIVPYYFDAKPLRIIHLVCCKGQLQGSPLIDKVPALAPVAGQPQGWRAQL